MRPMIFNLGVATPFVRNMANQIDAEYGTFEQRDFPDGETFLRINSNCEDRSVLIVCSLDRPNNKILPLLLMAQTLRDLGSVHLGLVAPYLPYMRQDRRFHRGEGVSARYFAEIISANFDWISTVDPHLHRIHSLADIYTIPTRVAKTAGLIARWIRDKVPNAVLIGPDQESEQWVADIAQRAAAPYVVLNKMRTGDRQVTVSIPDLQAHASKIPVVIDDIVSTGGTLVETLKQLVALDMPAPVAIVIHGIFATGALEAIERSGVRQLVTCNTILHNSNAIDVSMLLGQESRKLLMEVQERT